MLAALSRSAVVPRRALSTTPTSTGPPSASSAALASLGRAVFAGPSRAEVTFLVGGPGTGKGTLSAMIASRLRYAHISVGDLLRREALSNTLLGAEIRPIIEGGGIVCSSISMQLLLRHIAEHRTMAVEDTERWIIDGFPRKLKNAMMWEEMGFAPRRVVALELDDETMAIRLGSRGRPDDVPAVIRHRIRTHNEEWPKIRDFYRERGLLTVVDADGSPEDVWERFLVATQSV